MRSINRPRIFYCILFCAFVGAATARAQTTWYVDDDGDAGNGCTNWGDACPDLQTALGLAISGDQVWVAVGTYKPTSEGDRLATFTLAEGIAIYGGFDGTEIALEERAGLFDLTVLSGDLGVADDSSDNSYHVVTGSGTDATAVLDGFTVSRGNADAPSPNDSGAGMYNLDGSPTVTNCRFTANSASTDGGAMSNTCSECTECSSNPLVTNCTFIGNSTNAGGGGGMHNNSSCPTVTNCLFSGNTSGASIGGAMFNNTSSEPTVVNCTFSSNSAVSGGGMSNQNSSSATVVDSVFWGNSDNGGTDESAQVHNDSGGTATVTYSVIQDADPDDGSVYPGTGNIDDDPLFADADGPDNTYGTEDDNLRLMGDSPCVDSGDNSAVTVATDLDGRPRIIDGDEDATATVDMGAYEFSPEIFVDADATGPAYDGSTWCNAYLDLQDALTAATSGTTVRVANGTYKPTPGTDRTISFALNNGVVLEGGYAGCGADDPDERDVALHETILSGELVPPDDIPPGTGGGIAGETCDAAGAISYGVTAFDTTGALTDGPGDCQATQDIWYVHTALYTGTLHVSLCGSSYDTVLAVYEGGTCAMPQLIKCNDDVNACGAQSDLRTPVVEGIDYLILVGGYGGETGAGTIDIQYETGVNTYHVLFSTLTDATAVLDGFTVTGGNASEETGMDGLGGGMFNAYAGPTVSNCTFRGNRALGGAGMTNYLQSMPMITNCTFDGNSSLSMGGAMYNISHSVGVITGCTFIGNSAVYGGAIYNSGFASVFATNTAFIGNTASEYGGAIVTIGSQEGQPALTNCAFSGNSAPLGGALFNYSAMPAVTNCTFSGNTSDTGGAIHGENYSATTIVNSVLWGNSPVEIFSDGTSTSPATYSDIQGGTGQPWFGAGCVDEDPMLADPDGPDDIVGTEDDDLRLSGDPACIDTGDNAAVPVDMLDLDGDLDTDEPIPFDLDGNPRMVDGDNDDTATVDMGAYEFSAIPVAPQAPEPDPWGSHVPKNRYVSMVIPEATVASGGDETAIRVRLTSLHHPDTPDVVPDFGNWEGRYRWVNSLNETHTCPDSPNFPDTTYACAVLGCDPEYRAWAKELGGVTLHVTGAAVVPSSEYEVARLAAACAGNEASCAAVSEELSITTAKFGDVDPLSDGLVVLDIARVVDHVKGKPYPTTWPPESGTALFKPRVHLRPNVPDALGENAGVLDIATGVDAVKGNAYWHFGDFGPCTDTCPGEAACP